MDALTQSEAVTEISSILNGSEPERPTEEVVEAVEMTDEEEVEEAEETTEVEEAEETEAEEVEVATEEEAAEEEIEEESETFIVNDPETGKEVELTSDELIRGHMFQKDYTRKTQAVAEQKKALSQQQAQYNQGHQQLSQVIGQLSAMVQEANSTDLSELAEYDPAGAIKLQQTQQQRKEALNVAQQLQARQQQQQRGDFLRQENEKLLEKAPHWLDASKRDADQKLIRQELLNRDFTDQDISGLVDHRTVLMALDAAKYRELQKKQVKVTKKVRKAPKTTKPGKSSDTNPKVSGQRRSIDKAMETGSRGDAFEAIKNLI